MIATAVLAPANALVGAYVYCAFTGRLFTRPCRTR